MENLQVQPVQELRVALQRASQRLALISSLAPSPLRFSLRRVELFLAGNRIEVLALGWHISSEMTLSNQLAAGTSWRPLLARPSALRLQPFANVAANAPGSRGTLSMNLRSVAGF
jgi:hypothetical protein